MTEAPENQSNVGLRKQIRSLPVNELDLQMQMTEPVWGKSTISPELEAYLMKILESVDIKGAKIETMQNLWALLGFYTRDVRLGNLSNIFGEIDYCRERLDYAGELLQMGAVNSFLVVLREAISVLELSQSRGGFLRRRGNTITQESLSSPIKPEKRSIFDKSMSKGGK